MREIKFMAWDIKNKKMCQVIKMYYVPDVGANEVLIQHPDSFDELLLGVDTQAVLLQYTGLKDKKGKEIYEGDICHLIGSEYTGTAGEFGEVDKILLVEYQNNEGFILRDKGWTNYKIYSEEVEVIGNIYENKELLD
jgi:uncharacterized phage protein (TIGR01671 family)